MYIRRWVLFVGGSRNSKHLGLLRLTDNSSPADVMEGGAVPRWPPQSYVSNFQRFKWDNMSTYFLHFVYKLVRNRWTCFVRMLSVALLFCLYSWRDSSTDTRKLLHVIFTTLIKRGIICYSLLRSTIFSRPPLQRTKFQFCLVSMNSAYIRLLRSANIYIQVNFVSEAPDDE